MSDEAKRELSPSGADTAAPRFKFTRSDSRVSAPDAAAPAPSPTPNVPIRSSSIPFARWSEGVRFGGGEIALGALGGKQRIGVKLTELPPGKQSCPMHYHLKEEEHFFILEGRVVLRTDEGRFVMGVGDYVCFPAGTRVAHCFENPFEGPCRMLEVGSSDPDEVAVYTESQKAKIRSLGVIVPMHPGASLDYWQGEAVDQPLPSAGSETDKT